MHYCGILVCELQRSTGRVWLNSSGVGKPLVCRAPVIIMSAPRTPDAPPPSHPTRGRFVPLSPVGRSAVVDNALRGGRAPRSPQGTDDSSRDGGDAESGGPAFFYPHFALQPRLADPNALAYLWNTSGSLHALLVATMLLWPLSLPFMPLLFGFSGAHNVLINVGVLLVNPEDDGENGIVRAWRRNMFVYHHASTALVMGAAIAWATIAQDTSGPTSITWNMVWLQLVITGVRLLQSRLSFTSTFRCISTFDRPLATCSAYPFMDPTFAGFGAVPTMHHINVDTRAILTVSTESSYTTRQEALRAAGVDVVPPLDVLKRACPDGVLRAPDGAPVLVFRPLAWPHAPPALDIDAGSRELQACGLVGGDAMLSAANFPFVQGNIRRRVKPIIRAAIVVTALQVSLPFVIRAALGVPVAGTTDAEKAALVLIALADLLLGTHVWAGGFVTGPVWCAGLHSSLAGLAEFNCELTTCQKAVVAAPSRDVGGAGGTRPRPVSEWLGANFAGGVSHTLPMLRPSRVVVGPYPVGSSRFAVRCAAEPLEAAWTAPGCVRGGWPLDTCAAVDAMRADVRVLTALPATPVMRRSILLSALPSAVSIVTSFTLAVIFTLQPDWLLGGAAFRIAAVLPATALLLSVAMNSIVLLVAYGALSDEVAALCGILRNVHNWREMALRRVAAASQRLDDAVLVGADGGNGAPTSTDTVCALRRELAALAPLPERLTLLSDTISFSLEREPGTRLFGIVRPGAGGVAGIVAVFLSIAVLGLRFANAVAATQSS